MSSLASKMFKLFLFVYLSAKFIALISANSQADNCTSQASVYYKNYVDSVYANLYSNDGASDLTANKRFYAANDGLVGMCLMNQISTKPFENVITSLYSYLFSIALLSKYANEATSTHLLQIMNFKSMDEMEEIMTQEIAYFKYDIPLKYTSEMKHLILADNEHQFTDDFKSTVSSFLGGEAYNLNFTDSSTVAAYGNEWIGQDILSSEQIFTDTGLIILSYNHFTIHWDSSFKPTKKVLINFKVSNGQIIHTNALYFEGYAKYCIDEGLNSEVIEFPLAGGFKIRIILPRSEEQLDEVVFQARSPSKYESAVANTKDVYLKLTVPIQEENYGNEDYTKGIKMVNVMTETFDSDSNVFSSAFVDGNGCQLSKMIHKMHLSITDDTETACEVSNDYGYDEVNVLVNRPFILDYICFANTRFYSSVVQIPVEENY